MIRSIHGIVRGIHLSIVRGVHLSAFLVCGLLLGIALPPGAAGSDRPHVVLILADDLGWNDVGYHGAPIETPRIDRLAREGVELDRFYVQPICTPTRSALLTGRSPLRAGLVFGVARPWDYFGLPQDEHLMSESFRDAGYQTAIVGKWHLGHSHIKQTPTRRGFQHFYGHLLGAIDYYTHSRFGGLDWQRNGESLREEGYTTDLVAMEASRIIAERDPDKPLFLYVPFNAPHSPMQAPRELIEHYADVSSEANLESHAAFIRSVADRLGISMEEAAGILDPPGEAPRAIFAAMVHSLDLGVGQILDALENAGIADDTIVLFTSDNGGHISLGASNAPLRGEKSTVFEGGIRVPAAIRWPAGLEGGKKVTQTITALDVFPTLAAATGTTAGNELAFDGVDRWPQIRGAAPVPPGEIFFGVNGVVGRQEALRVGNFKVVRAIGFEGDPVEVMLFDVEADPLEQVDLADRQPERVSELLARLDRWIALYPEGGAQGVHWPHPGWIPPRDYGAAVRMDTAD